MKLLVETFNHNGWEVYIYLSGIFPNVFTGINSDIHFYTCSLDKSTIIERFKKAVSNKFNHEWIEEFNRITGEI